MLATKGMLFKAQRRYIVVSSCVRRKSARPLLDEEPAPRRMPSMPSMPRTSENATVYGQNVGEAPEKFVNQDGMRIDDGRYKAFREEAVQEGYVSADRVFTDPVRTFAYGTDASFYRLVPKVVMKIETEEEVRKLLPLAKKHNTPVTFRAAGTSLSGQAVTDSILLKLSHTGKNWRRHAISNNGKVITVEPGLIGGEVNRLLGGYARRKNEPVRYRLGPDPASIDSCMIGGIVNNNSSGMCCGVAQNTYHTLRDIRVVFANGTMLDTSDPESRRLFEHESAFGKELCLGVSALAREVQKDADLSALIRRKFEIKCTTGYSINALVDVSPAEPIEIIKKLMVGSEGTLGFVSRATYNTVEDFPFKASTFVLYPSFHEAGRATAILKKTGCTDAIEIFDRAALTEAEKCPDMCSLTPGLVDCPDETAGLLIECRGATREILDERIASAVAALKHSGIHALKPSTHRGCPKPETLDNFPFRFEARESNVFWDMRKGLIPKVGAQRARGTSMLIEDVACPVDKLADMSVDLIDMFRRHGYNDASVFGHAMEGNMHLVFSQGFRNAADLEQFSNMMQDMCEIVALRYGGSLKGEHGTGRNVAPFVEMEWGAKAYALMWRIKTLFDPDFLLNPGVLLNHDMHVHKKNLKPSPLAHDLVDHCIECGFCESNCPSRDAALTPRQRITVWREINRLARLEVDGAISSTDQERLHAMRKEYEYAGLDMCAADGMCQEKCPVKINTGELVKTIREEKLRTASPMTNRIANTIARNFYWFDTLIPPLLTTVSLAHRVLGNSIMSAIAGLAHRVGGGLIPLWNPYLPSGAKRLPELKSTSSKVNESESRIETKQKFGNKVVYLPSCVTRVMGPTASDPEQASVPERFISLARKAGVEVVYPPNIRSQCCGIMFHSRGCVDASKAKVAELEKELLIASENGRHPIVCDTSPCLKHLKDNISDPLLKFSLYEPIDFVSTFLTDKLEFQKTKQAVAVHVPCSSKKLKLENQFESLVAKCAEDVVPTGVPCCGMAGDRGFRYPELTGGALQHLNLPSQIKDAYSTSRTCECSLSQHSDVHFRSVLHLLDDSARPKSSSSSSH
uniref:D-lactate dehydrogenase (cytochrome) n=1 Tax=Aureoumbra lagunensis TaxID=44058 RepID=A0A7S3JVZ8_9STRA